MSDTQDITQQLAELKQNDEQIVCRESTKHRKNS